MIVENQPAAPLLGEEAFATVVRSAPLVSIDLVLRDADGRVLVGRRTNEPARGMLFVPGGVIRKNETVDAAFARILAAETGLSAERSQARFLGVFEHFYPTNRFGDPSYGTHYVVLAYEISGVTPSAIRPDSQHSEFCWLGVGDLLASAEVHANTKAYFSAPVPASSGMAERTLGRLRGKFQVPDDFDAPPTDEDIEPAKG